MSFREAQKSLLRSWLRAVVTGLVVGAVVGAAALVVVDRWQDAGRAAAVVAAVVFFVRMMADPLGERRRG